MPFYVKLSIEESNWNRNNITVVPDTNEGEKDLWRIEKDWKQNQTQRLPCLTEKRLYVMTRRDYTLCRLRSNFCSNCGRWIFILRKLILLGIFVTCYCFSLQNYSFFRHTQAKQQKSAIFQSFQYVKGHSRSAKMSVRRH